MIPRSLWQDFAQDTVYSPSYRAFALKAPQVGAHHHHNNNISTAMLATNIK
jgi:hypothetical protein